MNWREEFEKWADTDDDDAAFWDKEEVMAQSFLAGAKWFGRYIETELANHSGIIRANDITLAVRKLEQQP